MAGDTNGQSDVFVRDRQTGTTTRVSVAPGGAQGNSALRPVDQRRWPLRRLQVQATNLVAGDTNGEADVFVHDRRRARRRA